MTLSKTYTPDKKAKEAETLHDGSEPTTIAPETPPETPGDAVEDGIKVGAGETICEPVEAALEKLSAPVASAVHEKKEPTSKSKKPYKLAMSKSKRAPDEHVFTICGAKVALAGDRREMLAQLLDAQTKIRHRLEYIKASLEQEVMKQMEMSGLTVFEIPTSFGIVEASQKKQTEWPAGALDQIRTLWPQYYDQLVREKVSHQIARSNIKRMRKVMLLETKEVREWLNSQPIDKALNVSFKLKEAADDKETAGPENNDA